MNAADLNPAGTPILGGEISGDSVISEAHN